MTSPPAKVLPFIPSEKDRYNVFETEDESLIFAFNSLEISKNWIETWKEIPGLRDLYPMGWFKSSDSIWLDSKEKMFIVLGEDINIILETSIPLDEFLRRVQELDYTLLEDIYR